ncbi:DNA (cytosine-5-)-methyltransferase, partial [Salmonella enterica]|nr:DNA (cytosine-5-)-methyltransferase [Salmonella enterica]
MKVFDLFCGTGGFSKGFENYSEANFEVVFGIDLLSTSIETFKLNHPKAHAITGDIRKVSKTDVSEATKIKKGDLDVLIGGPPCQGFSSIRPFRSSEDDDPRNTLFEEYASYVNFFRPKFFILENVVGLATHKNGDTIIQMQECFQLLGYDTDWKILNSAHFGVPQKRERLIMLGAPKGSKLEFPTPTNYYSGSTIGYKDKSKIILPKMTDNLPPAITTMEAIGDLPQIGSGQQVETYDREPYNDYQRERRKDNKILELHSATKHSPKMMEIIKHSGKNINC